MKKVIIIISIAIIAISIICINYYSYKIRYDRVLEENAEFEQYKNKEIYGIELGTIINKTIDKNTKNKVQKDEKGFYVSNEENSMHIEIYIQDNEQLYKMETFYIAGTEQFVQYYGNIKFKCSKIEYHKNTKKVKYLLFEQIGIS